MEGTIPALAVRGLRKVYGRKVALHDLTLTVQPGEVFGFLGPNGAGKTTTIKILTGLVAASAGEARIFGQPISDRRARARVGYLPEHFRFHDWLTGAGLLDFHARLAGLSAAERRARIPEVLRLVGLAGRGDDKVRGYSKGMQQRLGLAQAILHRPDVVLLDEPSSALDPVGRREVRDLIRQLRAEGVTVFLNSHLLGEVEMICDRVAIVDRGRVVREGPLAEVVGGTPEVRLTVDRADAALLAALAGHGEVLSVESAEAGPIPASTAALPPCGTIEDENRHIRADSPSPACGAVGRQGPHVWGGGCRGYGVAEGPRIGGRGVGGILRTAPDGSSPAGQVVIVLAISDLDQVPAVARSVVQHGAALYGLVPSRRSLEDVFVSLVEGRDG